MVLGRVSFSVAWEAVLLFLLAMAAGGRLSNSVYQALHILILVLVLL